MFGQYYTPFGGFDIEEYLFGEDNCLKNILFLCVEDRIFLKKKTMPILLIENWDIISNNVAMTRGDIRGLYNPLLETEYIPGGNGIMRETFTGLLWNTMEIWSHLRRCWGNRGQSNCSLWFLEYLGVLLVR